MVVTSITESQERTYKPESDAALAAKVEFSMPIRLEVIRAAIFLSRLRTTSPDARRRIGWRVLCCEGQWMTISMRVFTGKGRPH